MIRAIRAIRVIRGLWWLGRKRRSQLRFQEVENVFHGRQPFELLLHQANLQAALDLRDDADQIDGVQSQVLAQVLALVQMGEALADVVFEKLDDEGADGDTVHDLSSARNRIELDNDAMALLAELLADQAM